MDWITDFMLNNHRDYKGEIKTRTEQMIQEFLVTKNFFSTRLKFITENLSNTMLYNYDSF